MCEEMRRTDGFGDGHSKHFSEGDCAELLDATHSMFEGRRVVKFTFVREFLLEKRMFRLEEQVLAQTKELGEGHPGICVDELENLRQELDKFKLWQGHSCPRSSCFRPLTQPYTGAGPFYQRDR